jgi:hypothetical protein
MHNGRTRTLTVIQRFGSGLNVNVLFHTLALGRRLHPGSAPPGPEAPCHGQARRSAPMGDPTPAKSAGQTIRSPRLSLRRTCEPVCSPLSKLQRNYAACCPIAWSHHASGQGIPRLERASWFWHRDCVFAGPVGRQLLVLGWVLALVLVPKPSAAVPFVSAGSATVNVGDIFTIPISITDTVDLTSFQFDLSLIASILQVTQPGSPRASSLVTEHVNLQLGEWSNPLQPTQCRESSRLAASDDPGAGESGGPKQTWRKSESPPRPPL